MTQSSRPAPVPYIPALECPEPDEAETTRGLIDTMGMISAVTTRDYGRAVRSVHAKSHGLLYGEITIAPGLAPELAQGLFAQPATFPLVMRLSTIPGDILDDRVSTPRGMAIKVVGVTGERLPGTPDDVTQDFLLVNGLAFLASDARSFLRSARLLAATTDKVEGLKVAFSAVLRGTEKIIEGVGGQSPTLISLGGHPETHLLGETFYTQVPVLYGMYFGKLCVVPVSAELMALTHAPVDLDDKPDGLREALCAHFRVHRGEWEVRVQLCTNLETMPLENASVAWPEDESAYRVVARIRVAPQTAWSAMREAAIDEGLAFSPWHCLAAHRPLGSVMRVRKAVYAALSAARLRTNGHVAGEPRTLTMPQD